MQKLPWYGSIDFSAALFASLHACPCTKRRQQLQARRRARHRRSRLRQADENGSIDRATAVGSVGPSERRWSTQPSTAAPPVDARRRQLSHSACRSALSTSKFEWGCLRLQTFIEPSLWLACTGSAAPCTVNGIETDLIFTIWSSSATRLLAELLPIGKTSEALSSTTSPRENLCWYGPVYGLGYLLSAAAADGR